MIAKHIRTGTEYRVLFDAWSTETQRPTVVYMSLKNGAIFTRDKERFDERFEIVNEDPQASLAPNKDQPELQFPERGGYLDTTA